VDSYAGIELQYHVERATGAKLPILQESQRPANAPDTIYIGNCKTTEQHGIHPEQLKPNASVTRSIGSDLFLAGSDGDGSPIQDYVRGGSLFAVYSLLEDHMGVRWLWPGKLGEVIPARTDFAVSNLNERHAPALIHSRLRFGGVFLGPPEAWADPTDRGRYIQDAVVWMRRHHFSRSVSLDIKHSFSGYWARFGKDHPEYFNLLPDGTRRADPLYVDGDPQFISMNVSEPGLWRQIISDWKAHRTPFEPYIDASENDTMGKDLSPRSLEWDVQDTSLRYPWLQRVQRAKQAFDRKDPLWPQKLGSLSDRYARFWMEVLGQAQKEDPNATVMGFAYENYSYPPRRTKLNDHIIIGVVPPMRYPYTEQMRAEFRTIWDGWSESGARLMFRPNLLLDGHDMPVIYSHKLAEDYTYAYRHGMIATDFDSLTGQWATQGPNLYIVGRLTEHPDWTADAILDEYYSGFGPAKADVRDYFAFWERVTDRVSKPSPDPFTFYANAPNTYTPGIMSEAHAILDRAAKAVQGDGVAKERVAFLEHGLQNAELTLAAERAHRGGRAAELNNALEKLDAFRAAHEKENIADMGFLRFSEKRTWDRAAVPRPAAPGH
jgi:hypothetical protein